MSNPATTGLLETALYVDDLKRSISFYEQVFRFPVLYADHRMCALNVQLGQVLLLFLKGASALPTKSSGGIVPSSDGDGHLHLAFAIARDALENWRGWLKDNRIDLESTVDWPRGGTSIYFRDPDGHLLELATPGLWANY